MKKTPADTQRRNDEDAAKFREFLKRMLTDAKPEVRENTLRFSDACNQLGQALADILTGADGSRIINEIAEKTESVLPADATEVQDDE